MSAHGLLIRSVIFRIFLAVLVVVSVLLFLSWDRVVTNVFKKATGCVFLYSRWEGNPFGKSTAFSPELIVESAGVRVNSKKIIFLVDALRFIRKRQVFIRCSLEDAIFFMKDRKIKDVRNALDLVSSSGQTFGNVEFSVMLDRDVFGLELIRAGSRDIRITGNIFLDNKKDFVVIDAGISVSPELASALDENVRNRILSPEDNGWYGAVIKYSGNPDFLRALCRTFLSE